MKGVDVLFTCHIVFWMYASSRSGVTWCDANFSRCSINVRSPCASCPVSQTGKRGAAGVHVTPKPRNEAAEEIHYVHHSKYSSSSDALSSSFVAFTALG